MCKLGIVVGAVVVVCDIPKEVGRGKADDVFTSNDEGKIERAKLDVQGWQFMVNFFADKVDV